jgi:glycerol-3-phosphate dehydrogenase
VSGAWHKGWRAALPDLFRRDWDLLVIGGGITGAGVLLEASRRGLKALLVEQRDFAWGTSSRSSKLVHGGLRYLAEGRLRLTRESVREREALLRDAPGLVEPQGFAFADYGASRGSRRKLLAGLAIYDWLAGRRERHWLRADEFLMLAPNVGRANLAGGIRYTDARTDDARLVLRVLREAQAHGGHAVNYAAAQSLLREDGRVCGALVRDAEGGAQYAVRARLVINATGAWAGALHGDGAGAPRLRPLRGSHLVLPAWRLPLAQAISLMHPGDGRPVFAFPWEGATLVGTTDVDHGDGMEREAAITRPELDYLLMALRAQFPQLGLGEGDVLATFAGVRPVIDSGSDAAPSRLGRDHAVWSGDGLVTVTSGKLTTFRAIALDTLRHARAQLPGWRDRLDARPLFAPAVAPVPPRRMPGAALKRLAGRYGSDAQALLDAAQAGELEPIPGTETLWAELRWAARAEGVRQLDDLLLRRTRLGLLLREGGAAHFDRIRAICQRELGWDDQRWESATAAYLSLCQAHHGVPVSDDPTVNEEMANNNDA